MATTLRCRSLAAREISNLNISPPPIPTFLMRANLSRALIRKKPARSRAELSMWLRLVLASRKVERWRKRSGEWCGLRRYSEHPYLCGVSGDATDGKKAGLTLCPTHDCRPPQRLSCSSPDVDSPVYHPREDRLGEAVDYGFDKAAHHFAQHLNVADASAMTCLVLLRIAETISRLEGIVPEAII